VNNGIGRDFDRAVELARGEYCWLMLDDDLLKPGAVSAVLEAIRRDYSLVVVNAECINAKMSTVVARSSLHIRSDHLFRPAELDKLFEATGTIITYIGCVVIKTGNLARA
jgi:abequosyltransferase